MEQTQSPTGASHPVASRVAVLSWTGAVIVLLAGTFLPWLYSGPVPKNSYELAGLGGRLLDLPPWSAALLAAWPFLGPLWAVVAVLWLLTARRAAVALSLLAAVPIAAVSASVLILSARAEPGLLAPAVSGPLVTALGAVSVVMATVAHALSSWKRPS